MANFSKLPNELLVEIWSYVSQPKDIESFALASKTIRNLSGRVLQEHRRLTREFSTFHIGSLRSRVSAAGLLKEILTNPRVALYVKEFTITRLHRYWESEEMRVNKLMAIDPEDGHYRWYTHTPYTEEEMELFKQMAKRAKQFFRNDATPTTSLIRDIEDGNEAPIIALLLFLLTNLKSLVIEQLQCDVRFYWLFQYCTGGRGIEMLKRPIDVRTSCLYDREPVSITREKIFRYLLWIRRGPLCIPSPYSRNHSEYKWRVWSSDVNGKLMLN